MSLLVGKDDSNNSVLHITRGVSTLSSLKSGENTNTVFHSNMNFLTHTDIPCTFSGTKVVLSRSVAASLGSSNALFLVIINDAVYNGEFYQDRKSSWVNYVIRGVYQVTTKGVWADGDNATFGWYYGNKPSYDYNAFYSGITITSARIVKLNVVNNTFVPPPQSGNYVRIDGSSGVVVNGVYLSTLSYISKTIVNSSDPTFTIFGGALMQLVTPSTSAGTSLRSSGGVTEILSGTKVIISSQLSYRQFIRSSGSKDIGAINLYRTGWSPRNRTTVEDLLFSSFSGDIPLASDIFVINFPYATLFGRSDLLSSGSQTILSGVGTKVRAVYDKDAGTQEGSNLYYFTVGTYAEIMSDRIRITTTAAWNSSIAVEMSAKTMYVFVVR